MTKLKTKATTTIQGSRETRDIDMECSLQWRTGMPDRVPRAVLSVDGSMASWYLTTLLGLDATDRLTRSGIPETLSIDIGRGWVMTNARAVVIEALSLALGAGHEPPVERWTSEGEDLLLDNKWALTLSQARPRTGQPPLHAAACDEIRDDVTAFLNRTRGGVK